MLFHYFQSYYTREPCSGGYCNDSGTPIQKVFKKKRGQTLTLLEVGPLRITPSSSGFCSHCLNISRSSPRAYVSRAYFEHRHKHVPRTYVPEPHQYMSHGIWVKKKEHMLEQEKKII